MAKPLQAFTCQNCGARYRKWQGKCDDCGGWNTIAEESRPLAAGPALLRGGKGRVLPMVGLDSQTKAPPRMASGIKELDRALGGGLVPGSAVLIGGDPGIGKSTLLLQALAGIAFQDRRVFYFSGEEAEAQIQMRARRLGLDKAQVSLATATSLRDIMATLDGADRPDVVVIDSIQTVHSDQVESAPGTVGQVRACAQALIGEAKRSGTVMLLVGHVTKDGQIAGPRVLEHMVDTVLYFEGERGHPYRILRSVKNRFGGTDEIGVFEMTGGGLDEVSNPSALFLSSRAEAAPGAAVFAGIEGTRPLLCEIQALVAPTAAANPRRTVVGWDSGRLAMVLAVLDSRCGLGLAGADVFLNVAGGMKLSEPAADLAVAAALISSLTQKPLPPDAVLFGEISLSGDIRPVSQSDGRLKEAAKLGFERAWVPARGKAEAKSLHIAKLGTVQDMVDLVGQTA